MSQEDAYKKQLENERAKPRNAEKTQHNQQASSNVNSQNKNIPRKAKINPKKIAKKITSAASLTGFIEIRDIFFAFAAMLAALKDLFDFGIIGTLLTPLIFIVIVAAMLVCGSKDFFGKKKVATIIFGNLLEFIPGLNFLPFETTIAIIIYIFILQERQETRAIEDEKAKTAMASGYA